MSNRLPVVLEQRNDAWFTSAGAGGLVSALAPVLKRMGGTWIGWPGGGCTDEAELGRILGEHSRSEGYDLKPVAMSGVEIENFYQGYCNEIIWPLFHDLQSRCNFVPEYWQSHLAVNDKFAHAVRAQIQHGDFIWIQDYQLMGLARRLRELGVNNRLGFFLHIPFPPPDIFCKLPWRSELLQGLLQNDIVGFQTPRDLENFLDCIRKLFPAVRRQKCRGGFRCSHDGHTTSLGAYPIGIDYAHYADLAAGLDITRAVEELRREFPDRQIVLGVDRLDYTKGVPDRLRAFQLALARYPELHRRISLLQVVVPSREAVPEYQNLKSRVERQVTQINGEFTKPGWVPIHYVYRSLDQAELLTYYRAADVALVTPLKDGMNLVAKEYCACQADGDGVLILSEFAGAAVQLKNDAILVNPYDHEGVAAAIYRGVSLTKAARRPAMRRLRTIVRKQDVFWWVNRFLSACGVSEGSMPRPVESELPVGVKGGLA